MVGWGVLMVTWPVSWVMCGGGRAVVMIGKKGRRRHEREVRISLVWLRCSAVRLFADFAEEGMYGFAGCRC